MGGSPFLVANKRCEDQPSSAVCMKECTRDIHRSQVDGRPLHGWSNTAEDTSGSRWHAGRHTFAAFHSDGLELSTQIIEMFSLVHSGNSKCSIFGDVTDSAIISSSRLLVRYPLAALEISLDSSKQGWKLSCTYAWGRSIAPVSCWETMEVYYSPIPTVFVKLVPFCACPLPPPETLDLLTKGLRSWLFWKFSNRNIYCGLVYTTFRVV